MYFSLGDFLTFFFGQILTLEKQRTWFTPDFCPKLNRKTPPKFNSSPLKIYHPKKERIIFQASFFRGKLAVKLHGRIYISEANLHDLEFKIFISCSPPKKTFMVFRWGPGFHPTRGFYLWSFQPFESQVGEAKDVIAHEEGRSSPRKKQLLGSQHPGVDIHLVDAHEVRWLKTEEFLRKRWGPKLPVNFLNFLFFMWANLCVFVCF